MKASRQNCHVIEQRVTGRFNWYIPFCFPSKLTILGKNEGFLPYQTAVNTMMLLLERNPNAQLRIRDMSGHDFFKALLSE